MKSRNRNNFGKNKKLVKATTISVAFLVAAILIVTAIPLTATPGNTEQKIENMSQKVTPKADPAGLDPKWTSPNRATFLDNGAHKQAKTKNSMIIKPVYIEDGVEIEDSIIGPYVSIGAKSKVKNSIVKNSIINQNTYIEGAKLIDSLVGENAVVKGAHKRLNVGDNSEVLFG